MQNWINFRARRLAQYTRRRAGDAGSAATRTLTQNFYGVQTLDDQRNVTRKKDTISSGVMKARFFIRVPRRY
jgi:hypothetical protein